LYDNTRNVQELLARTERKIRDLCQGVSGNITIGAGTIPGEYILPSLLALFLQQHPGVSVNLVSADSQSIYKMWQAGKLSLCVIGFLPPATRQACKLWTDEIIPVAAKQMQLSTIPWTAEELCRYPLVLRHESSASMAAVRGALNSLGISLDECNVVLQVSGNEALKTAVKVGAGIGFVSRKAVTQELAEGSLVQVPVAELQIKRDFYALLNEGLEMPVTLALWEYLLALQEPG
jgi:DNA-binding transcriptional LysR family regulator